MSVGSAGRETRTNKGSLVHNRDPRVLDCAAMRHRPRGEVPERRKLSRRRLLWALAAVVLAAIAGWRFRSWFRGPAVAAYRRLAHPRLDPTPTGALDPATVAVLVATAEALVDMPLDATRYGEYFRWRAQHVPGYLTLYTEFATGDPQFRRRLIARARSGAGRVRKALDGVLRRDQLRYERYVLREILELFDATDAWVLLGYEDWPGLPRGLESYTRPVRPA